MTNIAPDPLTLPGAPARVFSRKDVVERTGIPNDVIAYWLKEGLLVSEVEENRRHRRFSYEQINIAALLGVMRNHGLNISQLRMLSTQLQDCVDTWRQRGQKIYSLIEPEDTDLWSDLLNLEEKRELFEAGGRLELVGNPEAEYSYIEPDSRDYADNFEQFLVSWIRYRGSDVRPRDENLVRNSLKLMALGDGKKLDRYSELAMLRGHGHRKPGGGVYNWYWSITPTAEGDVKVCSEGEEIGSVFPNSPVCDHISFIGVNIAKLFFNIWSPDLASQRPEISD